MKQKAIVISMLTAQILFVIAGCETKKIETIKPRVNKTISGNYPIITSDNRVVNIDSGDVGDVSPVPEGAFTGEDPTIIEETPIVEEIPGATEVDVTPVAGGPIGPEEEIIPPVGPGIDDDGFEDGIDDEDFEDDDGYFVAGICGDGKRSVTEQCDDGNANNLDGCNVLCRYPFCGNGVLELNEWCDDGNVTNGDGCNKKCEFERCGNACLDTGEQCDDGNLENGDGCSKCCWREECGNTIVDPGEQCDDGNKTNGDGCSQFCQLEICGNSVVTPNEQCDDGNHVAGDGCSITCTLEVPTE